MFFVIAVLASCVLAAAVLLLVAVSGGHLNLPGHARLTDLAKRGSALMSAQGTPPRFLDRLDESRPAARG